jgi:hypothetical protein
VPTRHERLRPQPASLVPVQDEILGPCLHRPALATNRPAVALAQVIGPLPQEFSPLSNTTA